MCFLLFVKTDFGMVYAVGRNNFDLAKSRSPVSDESEKVDSAVHEGSINSLAAQVAC